MTPGGGERSFGGLTPDSYGWLHPRDEGEVQRLVIAARAAGRRVRVRGAHHSVPATIAGDGDLIVSLDRLRHLRYDEATRDVTAGAGLRLGLDPLDPRGGAVPTLCAWMQARGLALPNLGGITHQTVAGFLATGSAGGSTRYDASTAVVALRLVDGTGAVHALRRGADDDTLDAVLVSLGSCGIVTEVTFRTEPAYDVAGTETVLPDRGGTLDLFAEGETGLQAFLERSDYARVLWWPQRGVQRIVAWAAHRVDSTSTEPVKAYDPMPRVFGSLQPAQIAAGGVLWLLVHWRSIRRLVGDRVTAALERAAAPLEGVIYRVFVDGDAARPQRFRGAWCDILPQDQQMDERWMPTTFTEVFVPLDKAGEAMRRLDALVEASPAAAGQFAIELYASPASRAWLHPSYGTPSLRVNVFWLMHAADDPRDVFLPRLWTALAGFAPRLHWGKLYPHEPATMVSGRYPKLAEFTALRERLDPDRLFLTEWLASALAVPGSASRPPAPLPRNRMPTSHLQWPMLFALEPSDDSILTAADHVYEFERTINASGEEALAAMFDGMPASAAPGFVRFVWQGPVGELSDAVMDETFVFMNIRMRTVAYEPGRRLLLSIDRCSMPLARQMAQSIDITPVEGGCRFRWRIAVRYRRDTGFASPVVVPLFRRLFEATISRLEARFARR